MLTDLDFGITMDADDGATAATSAPSSFRAERKWNEMRINRERLASAMVRVGVNNRRLSELTGLNRSTVSAIKNGKNCSPLTAQKLVSVLGSEILEETHNYYGKEL